MKRQTFQILQAVGIIFSVFCKFQPASDKANRRGRKIWNERKGGRELKGAKEESESNEEGRGGVCGGGGVSRGHVASPCTCSLRCREADCIVEAPA